MPKRDSLLNYFQKIGQADDFPRLAERLALEDIVMPDLRHTMKLAELEMQGRDDFRKSLHKDRTAPQILPTEIPAQAAPTSWKTLLTDPPKYLTERLERKIAKEIAKDLPPERVRNEYKELTDREAAAAYKGLASGARLINAENNPELDSLFGDLCHKAKLIPKPRLIVIDSDLPFACAGMVLSKQSYVMISTNIIENVSRDAMRSTLSHELRHLKERCNMGIGSYYAGELHRRITLNHSATAEEKRADKFSIELTGSAHGMAEGLLHGRDRTAELAKFSQEVKNLLADFSINRKSILSPAFEKLLKHSNAYIPIFEEPDLWKRMEANLRVPHPPLVPRFDHLHAAEISLERSQAKTETPNR